MADLVISDTAILDLQAGFENVQSNLNLTDNPAVEPSKEIIGARVLTQAVQSFNEHVTKTREKYTKKTDEFIEFLGEVMNGSEQADSEMATALAVEDHHQTIA